MACHGGFLSFVDRVLGPRLSRQWKAATRLARPSLADRGDPYRIRDIHSLRPLSSPTGSSVEFTSDDPSPSQTALLNGFDRRITGPPLHDMVEGLGERPLLDPVEVGDHNGGRAVDAGGAMDVGHQRSIDQLGQDLRPPAGNCRCRSSQSKSRIGIRRRAIASRYGNGSPRPPSRYATSGSPPASAGSGPPICRTGAASQSISVTLSGQLPR